MTLDGKPHITVTLTYRWQCHRQDRAHIAPLGRDRALCGESVEQWPLTARYVSDSPVHCQVCVAVLEGLAT